MLALAPTPVQQHPNVPYFSQPPSANSAAADSQLRSSRNPSRRSSTSTTSAASTTSSILTASSTGRSSQREGTSPPRRSSSHSSQFTSSSYRAYADGYHQTLPHPSSDSSFHRPHVNRPPSSQYSSFPPAPPAASHSHSQSNSHSHPIPISPDPPNPGRSEPPLTVDIQPTPTVDIHAYDSQELLRLLASLLSQIATTNDALTHRDSHLLQTLQPPAPPSPIFESHHPPIWRTLTTASRAALSSNMSLTFHARNVPTITLEAYLLRILKYCPASNEVFLSLLVYFDRMSKLAKEACGKDFVIDSYNIHRLVIAGITVASKFFSDVFYTNSRYAKVGGLPQTELNQLELQFLLLNDFRLMISKEEMQRYAEQLIHFSYSQQNHANAQQHDGDVSTGEAPHNAGGEAGTMGQSPSGPSKFMSSMEGYRERERDKEREASGSGPTGASHSEWSEPSSSSYHAQGSRTPHVQPYNVLPYHPLPRPPPSSSSVPVHSSHEQDHPQHERDHEPMFCRSSSYSYSDAASEVSTDFEGSTDDEPTIRAGCGSASQSDADSVYSRERDADSLYSVERGEDEGEEGSWSARRWGAGENEAESDGKGVMGAAHTPNETKRDREWEIERARRRKDRQDGEDYRMTSP